MVNLKPEVWGEDLLDKNTMELFEPIKMFCILIVMVVIQLIHLSKYIKLYT